MFGNSVAVKTEPVGSLGQLERLGNCICMRSAAPDWRLVKNAQLDHMAYSDARGALRAFHYGKKRIQETNHPYLRSAAQMQSTPGADQLDARFIPAQNGCRGQLIRCSFNA